MNIFLDNASTSKPCDVRDIIDIYLKDYWKNPNAIYSEAKKVRAIIDDCRKVIAKSINANPEEIVFCPSASASNTLAIKGFIEKNRRHRFFISEYEHDSIDMIDIPYVQKNYISVNSNGKIDLNSIDGVKNDIFSITACNSEIGIVNDIKTISNKVHSFGGILHSDLTQLFPYRNINVKELDVDMATISAHKIGALRGVAVLYVKNGIELSPLIYGHQEKGLVGGTEDTLAIMCFADVLKKRILSPTDVERKINYLLENLNILNIDYEINGDKTDSMDIPIINIYLKDIKIYNIELISLLDLMGIEISSGSACNSYSRVPSKSIKALGANDDIVGHSIRISFSENITFKDIRSFAEKLNHAIESVNIFDGGV